MVVSKWLNRHRQRFNKRPKFEHIQNALQAEKEQLQVPGQKSKKSFVCVSLHCWQWGRLEVIPKAALRGKNLAKTLGLVLVGCVLPSLVVSCHWDAALSTVPTSCFQRGPPLLFLHWPLLKAASNPVDFVFSCVAWGGAAPPPPITCPNWTKSNDDPLALIGPGVVVDSLALRRTISGICFIYKLMWGRRVPCLQTLLPPRATHGPLPRTRQQVQDRKWPQLSAFFNSTAPIPKRSPPIFPLPLHPNLKFPPPPPPPSVLREPSL